MISRLPGLRQLPQAVGPILEDTVALLEGAVTPEDYRSKWSSTQEAHRHRVVF